MSGVNLYKWQLKVAWEHFSEQLVRKNVLLR
mgnify:FL=1